MSRRSWALFAAMCVIWGIPYLLIRVAVRDLSPTTVVVARTAIGALLLLPVAAARGSLRGLRGHWRPLLLYTAVEVTVPWLLLTAAEQHLTSSLSGLLVAATPLAGLVLGRVTGIAADPVGPRRVAGLAIGLAGVAALVGLQLGHVDLPAVLAVLGVAVGYAAGPLVLVRRLSDVPSLAVVSVSLGITALVYAPFVVASPPHSVSGEAIAAVVVLAVVCTALAFLVFFALIADIGPTRAVVITYVNPAVAVGLGVLLLGEPLTRGVLVGFPLVLLGSVLATSRTAPPPAETPVSAPETLEHLGTG